MKTIMLPLCAVITALLFSIQPVIADQPRMHEALEALRVVRVKLEKAEPDKEGHRERAIALVDQAIAEVKAGVRDAR